MRHLSDEEEALLNRYLKVGRQRDRLVLFKLGREASNAMLYEVEALLRKPNPSAYELSYLQGINRRRSKNYRKLTGIDSLIRTISLIQAKTLESLGLGGQS